MQICLYSCSHFFLACKANTNFLKNGYAKCIKSKVSYKTGILNVINVSAESQKMKLQVQLRVSHLFKHGVHCVKGNNILSHATAISTVKSW